ncbi:MAG: protein kinase domain-containing protein [Verrucomicrobiaceae bacterium]
MDNATGIESASSCGICDGELIDGLCAVCLFGTNDLDGADLPEVLGSFGKYELLEELARGGMGVVYRAFQKDLKREVALKMIVAGQLAGPDAVQRFRTEAEAAAKLHHPNIVPVFETGECEAQYYFTMRLIEGGRNIADWARNLVPQKREKLIAHMVVRVARAIAFAHERGILHRDLKPSNILIDEDGDPQVTDFGLAKFFDDEEASGLTLSKAVLGSPSYMSPEQAEGRHADITVATDVYGLGAVLYELLRGKPPFSESSPIATARAVIESEAPKLTGVSRDLATVCFKCLDKSPGKRYSSASLFSEDLERVVKGDPILASPISRAGKLWRWAKREPVLAGLVLALGISFLLGFAGVTWQWRKAEAARAEQARTIRHLEWRTITNYLEDGRTDVALATLARRLRGNPAEWQAAMYAMSIVDQQDVTIPVGRLIPVESDKPLLLFPDGLRLATVTAENDVIVIDLMTGAESARLELEAGASPGIAVSPTSDEIAVVTVAGEVILWSFTADQTNLLADGLTNHPSEPQFSTDGASLAFRHGDQVEVFTLDDQKKRRAVASPGGQFSKFRLGGEGESVGFFGDLGVVFVEISSGKVLFKSLFSGPMASAHFADDGSRVVIRTNLGQRLEVWDVASQGLIYRHLAPGKVIYRLDIDQTGSRLAFSYLESEIRLVNLTDGTESREEIGNLHSIGSLVFSDDGTRLASRGMLGRISIWDGDRGNSLSSTVMVQKVISSDLQLSSDGRFLLASTLNAEGQPGVQAFQSISTGAVTRITGLGDGVPMAGFNHNGDQIFTSTSGPFGFAVFDKETGEKVFQEETKDEVYLQYGSPDKSHHYAISDRGAIYGWDVRSGSELWPASFRSEFMPSGSLSPDGSRLLVGYMDGLVQVYDVKTGQVEREIDSKQDSPLIRFAPDSSGRFILGTGEKEAAIWNVDTGEKRVTLRGHEKLVRTAAFSADGHTVATGSDDGSVIVWDSHTGKPRTLAPIRHLSDISHLEIHSGGKLLATASRDHTARVWDIETGLPLCAPLYQGSIVESVRFTGDGRAFVTRDQEGFTYYDVETFEPVSAHFKHPRLDGETNDSDFHRSFLSADGEEVVIGTDQGEITVVRTRFAPVDEPVPSWFPRLLEALAFAQMNEARQFQEWSPIDFNSLIQDIERAEDGFYKEWALAFLPR